jgi:hypothetical protein
MAIVDLLSADKNSESRKLLVAIAGVAASCIADQAALSAPIVVTCDGPRTRIYCLYDDNALDETDARESALGFDPLKGDWALSLPCNEEDLPWVREALAKHSPRISARDKSDGFVTEEATKAIAMTLDIEGFFGK